MDAAGGALRACAAVPVGVRVGAYTGKFIFAASCCRDTVSYRTRKIRSGPAGGTASHGSSGSTGQPQADLNLTRPWLELGRRRWAAIDGPRAQSTTPAEANGHGSLSSVQVIAGRRSVA